MEKRVRVPRQSISDRHENRAHGPYSEGNFQQSSTNTQSSNSKTAIEARRNDLQPSSPPFPKHTAKTHPTTLRSRTSCSVSSSAESARDGLFARNLATYS